MKRQKLDFSGNAAIPWLLETYNCPTSFHAVLLRFLGEIASLDFGSRPIKTVGSFWGGDLPVPIAVNLRHTSAVDHLVLVMSRCNSLQRQIGPAMCDDHQSCTDHQRHNDVVIIYSSRVRRLGVFEDVTGYTRGDDFGVAHSGHSRRTILAVSATYAVTDLRVADDDIH